MQARCLIIGRLERGLPYKNVQILLSSHTKNEKFVHPLVRIFPITLTFRPSKKDLNKVTRSYTFKCHVEWHVVVYILLSDVVSVILTVTSICNEFSTTN
jgi:hypothetical protein